MPEIQIRPANPDDIPILSALDSSYTSDFAWQMDLKSEERARLIGFREIRLPRSVRVDCPRRPHALLETWQARSGLLTAVLDSEPVGYASLELNIAPATVWITELVVRRRLRRQGIGSALILAAEDWGLEHEARNLVLEMQPKNHPAIQMALKLGYDLCGYNDRYYSNHDIGIFFGKSVR
jgi:GNAT superfamily N-acetyltransferase